ncbi:MAG: element excision factor XisH family protein [Saprospiraceae bacterium]
MVRTSLENEGWVISHDPYPLTIMGVDYEIDLGAEKLFAAERGSEMIAVEVKSFLGLSFPYDFHQAIGQYTNYNILLNQKEPTRKLYLAVPDEIYRKQMAVAAFQFILKQMKLSLIIFDPEKQKITQWINQQNTTP